MTRSVPRVTPMLPPVPLTPEQGLAQHRVVVLEYRDALRWFRTYRIDAAELTGESAPRRKPVTFGAPPAAAHPTHPAGRALRSPSPEPRRRLVRLPGGRDA